MNQALIRQIEFRLIEGGIHRILTCLHQLDEEQIQYRPNANSNSINNQVLHLDGNVRQWLIATMSPIRDDRQRENEFDPNNKMSKSELVRILQKLEKDIRTVFPYLESSNLNEEKNVQCYKESVFSIVIHVIEHFSYHVGQITYITKMVLDIDTGYYADSDLNAVNE